MILNDGTDTRAEVRRPGPYLDGLAVVLDRLHLDGGGNDMETDGSGGGSVRFGRRVMSWDSQGFTWSETFPTETAALEAMAEQYPYDDDDDDAYA